MSHYLEDAEARAVDKLALAPLAAADPRGLYDTVRAHGISMCGYIPATVALIAARALGATRVTVVGYATSADTSAARDRGRLRPPSAPTREIRRGPEKDRGASDLVPDQAVFPAAPRESCRTPRRERG